MKMDDLLCCEICGQKEGLITEADIKTHMLLEHDEQGPTCPLCDLTELTVEELDLHMNTAHVDILSPDGAGQKQKAKMNRETNGVDLDGAKKYTSAWFDDDDSEPEFETENVKNKQAKESSYPLQLRGPLSTPKSTKNKFLHDAGLDKENIGNLNGESLEMTSFNHDGSMLLYDSDEDDVSAPGSSTDSPNRKRPRDATNSSISDCSSITDEHRGEKKGPLKRFLQSLTPKKSSSNLNTSGIWANEDPTLPDFQEGQRSWEEGADEPECPFCDLSGLDPETLKEHIEVAHSSLLDPDQTKQNKKVDEPKPTLLSLSQSAKKSEIILCPICGLGNYDADFIANHIETEHSETETSDHSKVKTRHGAETIPGTSEGACPMCGLEGLGETALATHVESHFEDGTNKSRGVCNGDDNLLAWQLTEDELRAEERQRQKRIEEEEFKKLLAAEDKLREEEKQRQKKIEEEEFKKLQAAYGMDGSLGYQHQSEMALEKAVVRGKISVAEYHEQKGSVRRVVATGMDDGLSRTQGLINKLQEFYSTDKRNVLNARLCSDMDHFSATAGDRGWGCGYRNLQMLLSGMIRDPIYKNVVFNGRDAIPSIGKLQQLIEAAWELGWDPQGREQLGGKVYNTKKWIGATEIVALLSSIRTKYILLDFHRPTGPNGTHPRMFEWVKDYFGQPGALRLFNKNNQTVSNKMPLYLQHQGHSRTIIGYEALKDDGIRLLLFDPSIPHDDMEAFKLKDIDGYKSMRTFRKTLGQMKANQYQIVGVQGVHNNDREHEASKLIRSQRIP